MILNKLRILGFKSFADEAVLEFQPGLTAIVGPNGCGKSNICDAIRWVLGEQSARILRGKEMGDVIFNGTASRKPLSIAEVTLELTNLGSLPLNFQQIQITRRLYRSGESEYLINKRPCRLKDISDLFLEWGINKRVYSIVEQGNIDFILTAKPQERRILIETAAGILKYKERKRETEQRMGQTKENLIRIQDIQIEVENHRKSLYKQARRARLYKALCQQSEEKEKRCLMLRYKLLSFHLAQAQSAYEGLLDQERAIACALSRYESEREESRFEAMRMESDFERIQKGLWQIEADRKDMEKGLESLHQEKILREETLVRLGKDTGLLLDRQSHIKNSVLDLEAQIALGQAELSQTQERHKKAEEEKARFQKQDKGIRQQLELKRRDLASIHKDLNIIQNKLSHLNAKKDGLKQRICDRATEEKEILKEEERIGHSLVNTRKQKETFVLQANMAEEVWQRIKTERKTLEKKQNDLLRGIEQQQDVCAMLRHKHAHLTQQEKRMEGFHSAVRHLLMGPSGSLRKTLAQILSTEKQYEHALEAVLGNHLQDILVQSKQEALEMISDLKANEKGKGTFVPEHMRGPDKIKEVLPAIKAHPGFIGRMTDFVYCSKEHQGLVSWLLDDILLVSDLEAGMDIDESFTQKWHLLTLAGDIIRSDGTLTGGGTDIKDTEGGILSRKRQLKDAHERLCLERTKLEGLQKQKEAACAELSKLNMELEKIQSEISQFKGKCKETDRDEGYLNREKEKLIGRKNRIISEKKEWEEDLKKIGQDIVRVQEEEKGLIQRLHTVEEEIRGLERKQEAVKEGQTDIDHTYLQEGIALASLKERLSALEREKERAEAAIKQIQRDLSRIGVENEGIKKRVSEILTQIRCIEQKMPGFVNKAMEAHERLEGMRVQVNKARQRVIEQEESLKPKRHELEQVRKKLKSLEIEVAQWHTRVEDLRQAFSFPVSEDMDMVSKDEVPAYEKEVEVLKNQLDKLKIRIQNFGPVNMRAIDEYQAVEERYQFLNRQILDLKNALESLGSIIQKINSTSRELFQETFSQVNQHFQQIFYRLFEGGQAQLHLEEGMDALEAGIHIVAQPPGKRLQRVDLLSGGEKALTALALILAVYQLKPSPFCILDEVDAPLDETNVERFLKLVKEMKERTQFISITHCKKTMMEVDTLYGITMQTPGVSKVVSVRLDREANLHATPIQRNQFYQEVMQ